MFEFISESLKTAVNKLKFVDDEKALKNALDTLKKALLKADVHHKVTKELVLAVEADMKLGNIGQKQFLDSIKKNLTEFLQVPNASSGFVFSQKPPTIVLMTGLQGGGKTTSTAKLAQYLKTRNKKVLVAACDLQRLAAVEQLKQLSQAHDLDFFSIENEKNALKVAIEAAKKAKENLYDVLIVDTAGRLAIDEALMNELKEIKLQLNPDEIFYIADAMSGQDALKTAVSFNEALNISGVILTKFDADAKGGIALGVAKQLGVPLRFIGIGEKIDDFEIFVPDRIAQRIMGEGDLATLAEKAANVFDEKTAKEVSQKIKKGEFNFDDFLNQLESVKKLGNLQNIIGMIPGMQGVASTLKDADLEGGDMKYIRAMINSMTPKERANPSLLNNSRKRRIANGSGLEQMQVNRFLKQFENAAKIAKKISTKGGLDALGSLIKNSRAIRK